MNGLTINELKKICDVEIAKGNGDKVIMISDDDEGNGYHYLFYHFTEPSEVGLSEDDINNNIAKLEDTIILG